MKTHQVLRQAGYNSNTVDNFSQIAQRAGKLGKTLSTPEAVLSQIEVEFGKPYPLVTMVETAPFSIYGDIDNRAIEQMETAMKLPVAIRGAVMPDAHLGYSLPIGGVAQLQNAVSPSFVGYDIACRMTASVIGGIELLEDKTHLTTALQAVTHFGLGNAVFGDNKERDHNVMYDPLWEDLQHLQQVKERAWRQLGSSGSGNHFADIMVVESLKWTNFFPYEVGEKVLMLLTHSGSRGAGHKMAQHYMKLAEKETSQISYNIPKGYGWLSTDSEAGQEYLKVMNLMGDYAQANHHLIHDYFLGYLGIESNIRLENHHNFAWVQEDGSVVHRKGATPAEFGQAGLIPGSSGTHSYIVQGLGNPDSLQSSSHGAGRVSSRTKAKENFNTRRVNDRKAELNVTWIGVAEDENPFAYKDIDVVMDAQMDLVEPVAKMTPVVVVMGG